MTTACDGCLGTTECWICTGDGCHRCASTGRCHLCPADLVLRLVPRQPQPTDEVAAGAS